MRATAKTIMLLTLFALCIGPPSSSAEPGEEGDASRPVRVFVEPFTASDAAVEEVELHLIAHELFTNLLAGSKKFVFAATSRLLKSSNLSQTAINAVSCT